MVICSFFPLFSALNLPMHMNLSLPIRYSCHHISMGSISDIPLGTKNRMSVPKASIVSRGQGNITATLQGICKIHWTVEADLVDGQFLYLTGEPDVLGSWETEMAVLLSPTEHMFVWKAEVEMTHGVCFKYNYFIKEDSQRLCEIKWRPGPQFSLSVPPLGTQDSDIVLRDSWMQFNTIKPHAHYWGSWMEEICNPTQSLIPALARDGDKPMDSRENNTVKSKPLLNDHFVKDNSHSKYEDILSVFIRSSDDRNTTSERNQPMEEPWLLQSSLPDPVAENKDSSREYQTSRSLQGEVIEVEVHDQHTQSTEKLLPDTASNLLSQMESVSVDILINSSICTMQRIAVLEDANLVELLLEPVKSDVLCDSVYLGVVTKLVPHMGGAFVNIGSSRPSLMDINNNREPFIFPPFRRGTREKNVNESIADLRGLDFRDDNFIHSYDDEDHEPDDDSDALEASSNRDGDGSIVNPEKMNNREEYLCETVMNDSRHEKKWARVQKGTKIVVQVVKEGLGTKGPTLTASPKLRSRFWVLITCCDRVGVSKKITGVERTRLKVIAKTLQPKSFGLTVRTVAAGHSLEELQGDLESLLSTWKNIMEHAKSAALAADEGVEGAIPVILHRAMGQTLSIVQDYFNEKVKSMIVDSPRTYNEINNYLQEIAPDLCDRVQLYDKSVPLFDKYKIEEVIHSILSKRVALPNGGSLVIEQTEALVSIDVNGGHGMLGEGTSQEKAILEVNLAAAKQIARELRLRDIGGIIVVDFIDMIDECNKRMVYEEVKKAVERDRSLVKVSELSRHGLMEITRKRVRPSVTFMISEPCSCCQATGRVEALETSYAKIEQDICRLRAKMNQNRDSENPKSWPKFILRVDHHMCNYLTAGKKTRLAILSSSLKVWILLKVARGFTRGAFELKPFTGDKLNNSQQVNIPLLRDTRTFNPRVTLFPVKKWKTGGK